MAGRRHPLCAGSGYFVWENALIQDECRTVVCPDCGHTVVVKDYVICEHWWAHNRYYGRRKPKLDAYPATGSG